MRSSGGKACRKSSDPKLIELSTSFQLCQFSQWNQLNRSKPSTSLPLSPPTCLFSLLCEKFRCLDNRSFERPQHPKNSKRFVVPFSFNRFHYLLLLLGKFHHQFRDETKCLQKRRNAADARFVCNLCATIWTKI